MRFLARIARVNRLKSYGELPDLQFPITFIHARSAIHSLTNHTGSPSHGQGTVTVSPPGYAAPWPRSRQRSAVVGSVTVTLSAPRSNTGQARISSPQKKQSLSQSYPG